MSRRLLLITASLLALTACRVDVAVDVRVDDDGSGVVTVVATADADVVDAAPGLADDLRFTDLIAAGWTVDGPTATAAGGLTVSLAHPFTTPEQATAILATLNGSDGPFKEMRLARVESGSTLTFTLDGTGRVDAGLAAFADPDLLGSVGATPYADEIAAANLSPSQAIVITLSATLPGKVASTTSTATDALAWTIPLDGTPVAFATTSTKSFTASGFWTIVALVALAVLIVWVVLAAVFITYVVYARQRRHRGPQATRRGPAR